MSYARAAVTLVIGLVIAVGPLVGLWWRYRDKNATVKLLVCEVVCLVLIAIVVGVMLWTAIDYKLQGGT